MGVGARTWQRLQLCSWEQSISASMGLAIVNEFNEEHREENKINPTMINSFEVIFIFIGQLSGTSFL